MVTRFRVGSNRPTERLNLHVSSIYPVPKSYIDAFNDPNWQNAMYLADDTLSRYKAYLIANGSTQLEGVDVDETFSLVTLVDIESKLGNDGALVSDMTLYRSLAGSLRHITFTRPDISYVVQQVCLHIHDPREPRFLALKRILRYVHGTLDHGSQLFSFLLPYWLPTRMRIGLATLPLDSRHQIVMWETYPNRREKAHS
ncbi:ribonuclease H-like domain-containing protein [Tanacetum coccineum]